MDTESTEVLENIKARIEEIARQLSLRERERLYESLHDWAYRKYEEALIEGYEPEMQDCEKES